MIADVTLHEVISSCRLILAEDESGNYFLDNFESARFLWRKGYQFGCVGHFPDGVTLEGSESLTFEEIQQHHAIVGVTSKTYAHGEHAVVWDAELKMIRDPAEDQPQKLTEYNVTEWIPCPKVRNFKHDTTPPNH